MNRIILKDIKPEDYILAVRAATYLVNNPSKPSAILAYGDKPSKLHFHVQRNKASITVRPC